MIRRFETDEPVDRDERLGEAIEAFLALAEGGSPPDPDEFARRYPDLGDDLRAALEGLALVRGLVGDASGPGHRLEAGRRVAGYRIVRELGRGGMGIVYEAVHVDLDRPVALKVLGTHAAPDSNGRRRFLNEARTAAGLHHTHIVPVFDVGQVGGLCYYAMQRIEGSGLDRVVRAMRRDRSSAAGSGGGVTAQPTPPSPTEAAPGLASNAMSGADTATWVGGASLAASGHAALGYHLRHAQPEDERPPFDPPRGAAYHRWVARVGRQAAEALAHAHSRGIIHRDVKPSNLLVDARGMIWVADFGLARRVADPGLTESDSLLGTPRYMSPEQANNDPVDARTDVYSLGATLYELLTLRPPFDGRNSVELTRQITGKDPISPRQFDRRIPRDLETIVLKAMAKRPSDRYATAADLAEDLGRFLRFEPVRARRIGPIGRLWRVVQRHPSLSAVVATASLTVLAVATFAYVRVVQERDVAVKARNATQAALQKAEESTRNEQAARLRQLLSEASITRFSQVPNRREKGLDLLKQALALGPDSAQRLELRSEAVGFLGLRQVERRPAELPTGKSRGLVFGSSGSRLATLSDDLGEFRMWDVRQRELRSGPFRAGPESTTSSGERRGGGPRTPRLAAVGHHLAVAWPDGKGIRLFDAVTGSMSADLPMPGHNVIALLAAPGDQPRFVTIELVGEAGPPPAEREKDHGKDRGGSGGRFGFRVNLWDPEKSEAPIKTLAERAPDPADFSFPLVAVQPDGSAIATAWTDKPLINIWSAADGERTGGGPIDTQVQLRAVALGPDGLLAAAGGGSIRLWEVQDRSHSPLPSFSYYQGSARLLRFSPNGSLLALAGGDTAGVELWDPAGNALVAALPTADRVSDLAFSPDGRSIAIEQASSVVVWDVLEPVGQIARFSGFRGEAPIALAFGPGSMLAMASRGGPVRFWCADRCPSATQVWDDVEPTSIAFDRTGRLVAVDAASVRWYRPPVRATEKAMRLTLERGGARLDPKRAAIPKFAMPSALSSSADGRTFAMLGLFGRDVLVWSESAGAGSAEGAPRRLPSLSGPGRHDRTKGGPPPSWRDIALSPDGSRLYLINSAEEFSAWEIEAMREKDNRPGTLDARPLDWSPPEGAISSMALSPDGGTLALGTREGTVLLVETSRGKGVGQLPSMAQSQDDDREVRSLAWTPDSRELAVGTMRGAIRLWKVDGKPEPLVRLPGHRGPVMTLAFDPDGRRLASSGATDKTVAVWDLRRVREELARLGLDW